MTSGEDPNAEIRPPSIDGLVPRLRDREALRSRAVTRMMLGGSADAAGMRFGEGLRGMLSMVIVGGDGFTGGCGLPSDGRLQVRGVLVLADRTEVRTGLRETSVRIARVKCVAFGMTMRQRGPEHEAQAEPDESSERFESRPPHRSGISTSPRSGATRIDPPTHPRRGRSIFGLSGSGR